MAGRKKRQVLLLTRQELEPHEARFWEKVQAVNATGCRLWRSGHAKGTTYSFMLGHHNDGTLMNAKITRVAWALAHEECPIDKIVVQTCGHAQCVELLHLELREAWQVTQSAVAAQERPSLERYRENFLAKVVKRQDGCWFWNAARFGPYGAFWFNGKERLAHRVSYELFVGPIDPRLVVRHKCERKLCVNPEHLLPGTHADNMQDMVLSGLAARGENNGNGTLTQAQVLTMKLVWLVSPSRGVKTALARWFKITQTTVGHVLSQKTWWYEVPSPQLVERAMTLSNLHWDTVELLILSVEKLVAGP